jgi:hypothetical protein
MSRILELKQQYGDEQAKILNELATLGERAQKIAVNLSTGARERLGEETFTRVAAAERAE